MPSIKGTMWAFTKNFNGPCPKLLFGPEVQYAIWQHEKKAHNHLQGFIQMKDKNTSLKKMKIIIPGAHLELCKGSIEDNINYCGKDESRIDGPWEYGEVLKRGSNKRKVMDRYEEDPEAMKMEDPDLYLRCNAKRLEKEFMSSSGLATLSDWQIELHEALMADADDRSIIWVYGPKGREGKSTFAKELIKRNYFYSPGGKTENILYLYSLDPERNCVFDFPRCNKDFINYSVIEMIKNGVFSSTKYRPVDIRVIKPRHVVIMCNELPDVTKISEDRIKIINC
ncbi:replication initiator protein [Pea necrotic yellow dwarf alphasatellite 6]|nr:replication initiator protein [Pea necrotic yellow dwarf alphasatellite 6]QJQ82550.1 replication initiator protein [Pea necrotic yellow dwarf alphasatellite 6]